MARSNNVPDPRNYPTTAAYRAAMDAQMGPRTKPSAAALANRGPNENYYSPAEDMFGTRPANGYTGGWYVDAQGNRIDTPSNPNLPRQTPLDPGQQSRAGQTGNPNMPRQTPYDPGQQARAQGAGVTGANDLNIPAPRYPETYATLNSSGVMIPGQVADTTYTLQPRDHVPKASDAWASADETADGGVNWKGTGNLQADHPDWWGEVKNYDPATQQRMLNDYKNGDEANFQNERDDARARHMVASGWANPDGSTPTAKITKPDPTGATASSAWMSDSSTPSTTPDTASTSPVADTASTRTMPTTPADSTDTTPNKVSTGDIGGVDTGVFPGLGTPSASSIWTSPEAAQQPKDQIGNEPQVDTNTMTMPDGTTMPDMSMPAPDASATDAAQANPDNPDNQDDQALRLKLPTY